VSLSSKTVKRTGFDGNFQIWGAAYNLAVTVHGARDSEESD
jgi:hypothetical protein